MQVIHANSVSEALYEALYKVQQVGIPEDSRNGKVLVMPTPVTTVYYHPWRRVLWSPKRNANPFFHLMEALWMLGGRNDLAFPMLFNKRFKDYSDDGLTIWGGYGWRWKRFFGYDQLDVIVEELRKNPNSRRCVLSMWNAVPSLHNMPFSKGDTSSDLLVAIAGGRDVPCNTHVYFDVRGDALNMTVCNRSNDMLWGCYGANAVHFSILQEYMSARLNVPMGVYRQMSNNLHLYTDIVQPDGIMELADDVMGSCRYLTTHSEVPHQKLVDCDIDDWHNDLHRFLRRDGLPNPYGWSSKFINEVAVPMYMAHEAYRQKRYEEAEENALRITAWDWRTACLEWLQRREVERAVKESRK